MKRNFWIIVTLLSGLMAIKLSALKNRLRNRSIRVETRARRKEESIAGKQLWNVINAAQCRHTGWYYAQQVHKRPIQTQKNKQREEAVNYKKKREVG